MKVEGKYVRYDNRQLSEVSQVKNLYLCVIYRVVAATLHCRIAFIELDTNLGLNQKYQKYHLFCKFYSFIKL